MNRSNHSNKSKKVSVLISFFLVLVIIILILLSIRGCSSTESVIYAGVGGCVVDRGVYPITKGETLFELIRKAKGITANANIENLDLDLQLKPWEVYCIPSKPKESKEVPTPVINEKQAPRAKMPRKKDIEQINIIYAGLPRTFILITIYPELEMIKAGHIPWFTAIPNTIGGTKTLYEMYLIGGVRSLVKSVESITSLNINYFFSQDRPSWIKFIDHLGGIKVDIPKSFAKQYGVNPGTHIIDGYTAWLYITFISKDMRTIDFKTGSHYRIKRQKDFMVELYKKFMSMDFFTSSKVGKLILNEAETNIGIEDALPIAIKIKKMKKRNIDFYTLPGMYRTIDGKNYWETNLDEYQQHKLDLLKYKD